MTTDVGVEEVTQELDDDGSVTDEPLVSTPTEDTYSTETPTEDAQTTETETPEETATPTPTAEDDSSPTPTSTATQSDSGSGTTNSTPTPTPTETPGASDADDGPATTADSGTSGSSENEGSADESGAEADESNDANATDADEGSRNPSDFEDAADGNETADPDGPDGPEATDVQTTGAAPGVESRSRQRMPSRGPEEGTIVMSFDDVPVSTISFTTRQYGNVTIDVLAGLPRGVEPPAGDQLSTIKIYVPEEVRDSPAKVMFTVDVATLETRGVPNDAVWLAHYDTETDEWNRLETDVIRSSGKTVSYKATTPGFSLFTILGDSNRPRNEWQTGAATVTDAEPGNVSSSDGAEASFVGGLGHPGGMLVLLAMVSVGIAVLGARQVSTTDGYGREKW